MRLVWAKHMIGNIVIAGSEITKGRDKIIISITHNDSHEENEYPGLITMRRGDRHNELFTLHFVAHGWTDEEVYEDSERIIQQILEDEIKKYQTAMDMVFGGNNVRVERTN